MTNTNGSNHAQRVLITGHNGYIGSVMAPMFFRAGHEVVGLDTGYYNSCTLVPDTVEIPCMRKDVRDVAMSGSTTLKVLTLSFILPR
jgi:nucleoside-diphosphate-sugar epimerase